MSLCAMAELKLCCKRRYESRPKDTDEATEGVKRHKINTKEGTIAEHEDVNHDGLPALFIINITWLPPLHEREPLKFKILYNPPYAQRPTLKTVLDRAQELADRCCIRNVSIVASQNDRPLRCSDYPLMPLHDLVTDAHRVKRQPVTSSTDPHQGEYVLKLQWKRVPTYQIGMYGSESTHTGLQTCGITR